ncbi:hypothetical protein LPJ57_005830 [Coemansia sp. RSA 486]|nr:hypothetical protein LPJ57_005830 [Coemansia sp. RSA 486]KAJ2596355.1 hypothetical protein GGF39_003479 [Coemansia sp. RSA 1721]
MLQSFCNRLRTRFSTSISAPRRGFSSTMFRSNAGRMVSSVGGRKISVHEHHNVNEIDDQVPLIYREDEHTEAGIYDDMHEKAIALDAAHASEYGQVHVHPSSSSKHQKVRTLESE